MPQLKTDIEKIGALAARVAEEEMVEVFDLEVMREGPRTMIRVFLEREGGIRIADCESFSRKLGAVLDVEDPMPGPYVLEVSSPGVNRKLTKPAHFAASVGRRIRVSLSVPVGGARNFAGILARADGEGFEISTDGKAVRFGYGQVRKASLDVSQEELFGKGKGKR